MVSLLKDFPQVFSLKKCVFLFKLTSVHMKMNLIYPWNSQFKVSNDTDPAYLAVKHQITK